MLIPLAVGGLSSLITGKDMKIYDEIVRPPLSPPGTVFPIVWAVLYVLMGISLYLYWNTENRYTDKTSGYVFFALQLFFNLLWSPMFFSAKLYLFAFIILLLMIASLVLMMTRYYSVSKCAAVLQLPYLLWLLFAAYLNFGIFLLN